MPCPPGLPFSLVDTKVLRKKLLKAYVVVFNQGEPQEGVYTLFVQVRMDG